MRPRCRRACAPYRARSGCRAACSRSRRIARPRPAPRRGGACRWRAPRPCRHRRGAHQEALLHVGRDTRRVGQRLVERQIRRRGGVLAGVDEHDAALERFPVAAIERDLLGALVQRQDELAARARQRRPAARQHRIAQGRRRALHVVRRDQVLGRQHAADLGVQRVEGRGVEFERLRLLGERIVLGVEGQQDRHVAGMRARPAFEDGEAVLQRDAARAVVEILDVQHLEARPGHVVRIAVGQRLAEHGGAFGVREQPALRIVGDVDLDGAGAVVQLIAQRGVEIIERRRELRRARGERREQLRIDRLLVAVMGSDGDDVVEAAAAAIGGLRRAAAKQPQ